MLSGWNDVTAAASGWRACASMMRANQSARTRQWSSVTATTSPRASRHASARRSSTVAPGRDSQTIPTQVLRIGRRDKTPVGDDDLGADQPGLGAESLDAGPDARPALRRADGDGEGGHAGHTGSLPSRGNSIVTDADLVTPP